MTVNKNSYGCVLSKELIDSSLPTSSCSNASASLHCVDTAGQAYAHLHCCWPCAVLEGVPSLILHTVSGGIYISHTRTHTGDVIREKNNAVSRGKLFFSPQKPRSVRMTYCRPFSELKPRTNLIHPHIRADWSHKTCRMQTQARWSASFPRRWSQIETMTKTWNENVSSVFVCLYLI